MLIYSHIKDLLSQDLPGQEAQERVRPRLNGTPVFHGRRPRSSSKKGAVLLLLFPSGNDFELVFTKRVANLKEHGGQISFPGGRIDAGETAMEAALRECWEETGVRVSKEKVLGQLSSMYIVPSDFVVSPFVAALESPPKFLPSIEEVDQIFSVPLSHLLDEQNLKREIRIKQGRELDVFYYDWNGFEIWGGTAAMLSEFVEILNRGNMPSGGQFY